jgi:hypothetical protein
VTSGPCNAGRRHARRLGGPRWYWRPVRSGISVESLLIGRPTGGPMLWPWRALAGGDCRRGRHVGSGGAGTLLGNRQPGWQARSRPMCTCQRSVQPCAITPAGGLGGHATGGYSSNSADRTSQAAFSSWTGRRTWRRATTVGSTQSANGLRRPCRDSAALMGWESAARDGDEQARSVGQEQTEAGGRDRRLREQGDNQAQRKERLACSTAGSRPTLPKACDSAHGLQRQSAKQSKRPPIRSEAEAYSSRVRRR